MGVLDEIVDPFCDPEHPVRVTFDDVIAAADRIRGAVDVTPCARSHMSALTGMEIYFKKEFLQYTGSFKERGARNVLSQLTDEQKARGVIAASAGNHATALGYHGGKLNVPITVVMPVIAPMMKVQLCKNLGANVIIYGKDMGEAKEFAMKMGQERGLLYVNGYDHPGILAGQGTAGLEIMHQVPDLDAVVVPIGGGSIISGIAVAVKGINPNCKVYGVEPANAASFTEALKFGKPVHTNVKSSLADGLIVPVVGYNSYATAAPLVDKVLVVKEEYIAISILRLIELEKAVVEGAGATAFAAILAGLTPELKGKKVAVVLTGGNIDTNILGRCLERGLAADGRIVKFAVTISDRPGGIAELGKRIASLGVSVKEIVHERAWVKNDVFSAEIKCICETRDAAHGRELEKLLRENYSEVDFGIHSI